MKRGATPPRRCWRRRLEDLSDAVGAVQERVSARPGDAFVILASVTLLLGTGALRLSIDNRPSSWLPLSASPLAAAFPDSTRDFALIVRRGADASSGTALADDRALADALASLPGVAAVESVSDVLDRAGASDLEALGAGRAFLDDSLLHAGGDVVAQRVWLEPDVAPREIVAAVHRRLDTLGVDASVLGPAAFNAQLDALSRRALGSAMPLALAVVLFALTLAYRSVAVALGLIAASLVGVAWTLGALGWSGVSFNFLSVNVPTLGFVIGVAIGAHPVSAWTRRAAQGASLAGPRAVARATFAGCFLAATTTAVGFASLALARAPVVREFGLLSAGAILAGFAAVHATLPLVFRWVRPRPLEGLSRLTPALVRLATARRIGVRVAAVGCFAAGVAVLPRISTNHDALDLFPADEPFRIECERAGADVAGLAPVEYLVTLDGGPPAANLRRLERIADAMARATGAPRALSAADVVKLAASRLAGGAPGSYALPASDLTLGAAWSLVATQPAVEQHFASPDARRFRVVLPLGLLDRERFDAVLLAASRAAGDVDPEARVAPGGRVHQLMTLQSGILDDQARSLAAAVAGVSLLVGAAFGSLALAAVALLMTALPIVVVGAAMALGDQPLDLMTAMVGSVALGIAVDDTVHILWERRRAGTIDAESLRCVLDKVGPPVIVTSIVLSGGFAVLATAQFPPISRFGLLTATTLVLSLLVHLVVLPAFLLTAQRPPASRPPRSVTERGTATTALTTAGLLLMLVSLSSCAASRGSAPSKAGVAPTYEVAYAPAIEDQYGESWSLASVVCGPAVLILGEPASAELSTRWDNEVVLRETRRCGVASHRAVDLRSVPRIASPFVSRRIRNATSPPGTPVLLDWEGVLAQRWRTSPGTTTLVVVGGDGHETFRVAGAPEAESAAALADAIASVATGEVRR